MSVGVMKDYKLNLRILHVSPILKKMLTPGFGHLFRFHFVCYPEVRS